VTWHAQAHCLGVNPEVFFPERGDMAAFRTAVAICHRCPVTEQCLEENIDEKDGVYAGLSGAQRRKLRSQRPFNRSCLHCKELFKAWAQQQFCSAECKRLRHIEQKAESAARAWWTET
jgi:WhiB family redox-sensing transcriptional regulator